MVVGLKQIGCGLNRFRLWDDRQSGCGIAETVVVGCCSELMTPQPVSVMG